MPNVLPFPVRCQIIRTLVEGNSIRATARLTDTDKDAVMRLGALVGQGCLKLHDQLVGHVPAAVLEIDETWSYVGRHERRKIKSDPATFGDTYTMFAIDTDTKLVPSFHTGKRELPDATIFMADLRERVEGHPQMSVDGWPHWEESIRRTFGHEGADVGAIVKEYQKACSRDTGNCGRVKSSKRKTIYGKPEQELISTSKAERMNMTTRMQQRRFTRLTNGYSKKKSNHVAAVGLHYFWYNFVRVHESIDTTPAVKAGVADHEWSIEELVGRALEEVGEAHPEPPPNARKRYQRKTHRGTW
jgi:hypothetical protein